jgi:hypothetical protein
LLCCYGKRRRALGQLAFRGGFRNFGSVQVGPGKVTGFHALGHVGRELPGVAAPFRRQRLLDLRPLPRPIEAWPGLRIFPQKLP